MVHGCKLMPTPSWHNTSVSSAAPCLQAELQRRLDAEFPRMHLDMRHRLDKDGNRYGKVIDYKVSEQRAVDLLDDLCGHMDDYTLIQQDSNSTSPGGDTVKAAAPAGSEEPSSRSSDAEQQLVWIKRKGEGSSNVPASKRPSKAEEDLRIKQLTTFCGMMLERYEDEVLRAFMSDEFVTHGVAPVLCQHMSKKCQATATATAAVAGDLDLVKHEL
eukprot:GHUV01026027.1.p1 GENE.GHUV01026027.1~~GHUV01026027.1.p1  ORF type:complete len:215 (+),score=63.94 GHUV01026027.1:288-932(+)